MTIKEIIDAERWEAGDHGLAPMPSVDHNASLDRIQAAVDKLIYSAVVTIELQDQRIAELEAQVPKVVKPIRASRGTVSTGFPFLAWTCPECGCRKQVGSAERDDTPIGDKFCSCGVKLNWEVV